WAGSREKRKFEQQLPDTLVLLATSLRAGYSLLQAVEAVASEAPDPTAREFGRGIAEARRGRRVPGPPQGMRGRPPSEDYEWAVEAVASEAPNPTAREFGRAIAEARLGRSVVEALQGITERTQSKDFEWAVMAIEIQREVGGNLAEVLQTVADTMLARNRLRG